MTPRQMTPARYWRRLDGDRIQCDLCPRQCRLSNGANGLCFVRANRDGSMVLNTYGRTSGFAVDVAMACHERRVRTVAVTAGYMSAEPRQEFYAHMDGANVDLKGGRQFSRAPDCLAFLLQCAGILRKQVL